jgi:hypothetical protein
MKKKKTESGVFMAMLQSNHSSNMKWNLYVRQKKTGLCKFTVMNLLKQE